jgi:prepilin-type N-terminal cleavage/methylation domain-containing protein
MSEMKGDEMKNGFTIVEVMIVVSIIGLLAAIAIPSFIKANAKNRAKELIVFDPDPVSTKIQENNNIELCFEYKGIKVYQFRGRDGRVNYFQSCSHCGNILEKAEK